MWQKWARLAWLTKVLVIICLDSLILGRLHVPGGEGIYLIQRNKCLIASLSTHGPAWFQIWAFLYWHQSALCMPTSFSALFHYKTHIYESSETRQRSEFITAVAALRPVQHLRLCLSLGNNEKPLEYSAALEHFLLIKSWKSGCSRLSMEITWDDEKSLTIWKWNSNFSLLDCRRYQFRSIVIWDSARLVKAKDCATRVESRGCDDQREQRIWTMWCDGMMEQQGSISCFFQNI